MPGSPRYCSAADAQQVQLTTCGKAGVKFLAKQTEFVADLMGELLERATHWARDGSLKHKEDIVGGLENAPEAFLGMLDGKNFSKLLVPVS